MTSKVTVPADKVLETLREVVTERPDYTYQPPEHMVSEDAPLACFYVHTDADGNNPTPGCLVGAVLNRVGVSLESLAKREGTGAWSAVPALLNLTGHPDAVGEAIDVLTAVQEHQDNGADWSRALELATGE